MCLAVKGNPQVSSFGNKKFPGMDPGMHPALVKSQANQHDRYRALIAALWSGVIRFSSLALTLAPRPISRDASVLWPCSAARCSGVRPAW